MNTNKIISIVVTVALLAGIIFIITKSPKSKNEEGGIYGQSLVSNVSVKDGIQYITIDATNGYSPAVSNAKAGIPTKLIMKTNGAFSCSSALVIHSLNYQKMLPQTGETEIDIGTPKAGEPLKGVCGMGMYSFKINFE
ncbi:MAG: cupredoxin domain-containing protein [Candidatus Nomurabacteria bacterium]|nr:cupredoxin domain-containing protein [Candidatus Nomurabacteria bacterium]